MKLTVVVKPNSKEEKVMKMSDGSLKVSVKALPIEGKANEAVIRVVAKEYRVTKNKVSIVQGLKGKNKIVEIMDENR